MKRFFGFIMCVAVVCGMLSGCGTVRKDSGKLNVVCTIFPQYDIVRQIAGDSVELTMLLPYSMESHDFKLENLSVKDLQLVSGADIIISVGGPSDSDWVGELKKKVGNEEQTWIELCSLTETLCVEEHSHDHGHGHDHIHGESDIDEHVWTSPKRMISVAENIAEVLKSADPEIAARCDEGLATLISGLTVLDNGFTQLGEKACTPIIFADRFSFRYLFHDYGLDYEAAFSGCSSSVDPSALQIANLTQKAFNTKANTIFYMENSNIKYAEKIAVTVKADTAMLHSCHNLSREEFKSGATYISLMTNNLNMLKEAVE